MARPSKYTAEEIARVIAVLASNKGNVKRTSRELGLPEQTVRNFKIKDTGGRLPAEVLVALPVALETQITRMGLVRDKALDAIEDKIDQGDSKLGELNAVWGTLTDKILLISGEATSRREEVTTGPSPEEFGERLALYLGQAFNLALDREADIVDAEIVEQAPVALQLAP